MKTNPDQTPFRPWPPRLLPKRIRTRLILLIFLAVLPLLAVQLLNDEQRFEARRGAEILNQLEVARGLANNFMANVRAIDQQNYVVGTAILNEQPFDPQKARALLSQAAANFPISQDLSWINPQGLVLASSQSNQTGLDVSSQSFFALVAAGQSPAMAEISPANAGKNSPTLAIATTLKDGQNRLLGVVLATIDSAHLGNIALSLERTGGGEYALFDRQGTLVYDSAAPALTWSQQVRWVEHDPLLQSALRTRQEQSGISTLPDSPGEWIVARVPIGDTGFIAGARRPLATAMQPLQQISIREAVVTLLVGLLAFALAFWMAHTIDLPISRLEKDALALGKGLPTRGTHPLDPQELRLLRATVERMAAGLMVQTAELKGSEERLVDILESIQDGFMEINWDWCFTYLNQRAAQSFGLQPREMIGKNIWESYPALLGSPTDALYRRVMAQRQPDSIEVEGVLTRSWYDVRVYPSREGITVFWSDISQRKYLEAEQRKLLVAVEQSPNTIMITDTAGRIEYVNPRFAELAGYTLEEVIGKNPSFLKTGFTPPEEYAALWKTIQSGQTWHGVFRNQKRGGEYYWEAASIVPVRDENGQISHFLAVKEDITERKRAEEALERSEARLRRLFDTSVIGIMTRELDGKIIQANDSLLQMLGYTQQDLSDRALHIHDLLPEEYWELEPQMIQETLDQGASRPREKEYLRKDGARVPVLVGLTRLDGPPVEISTFVIDLSDLKETQAALEEYTEKLKRSNQDLEQFAFVVSHDLQEPLRKITFFSESITKKVGGALDGETLDSFGRMQNAARRMREMIQDLLDLSRVSTRGEAFQEVDLSEVVQDVIGDLEGRIHKENGQVETTPLPTIQADRAQIQRLLQNLIGNALKYHKKDVPPRVKISAQVTPSKGLSEKQVTLRIEDNGIGFDEQYAERIFQPFQRLHGRNEYEGTGMGLTICKKIVERHHGQITASSQPEQGSTFIVRLPLRQPEKSPPTPGSA